MKRVSAKSLRKIQREYKEKMVFRSKDLHSLEVELWRRRNVYLTIKRKYTNTKIHVNLLSFFFILKEENQVSFYKETILSTLHDIDLFYFYHFYLFIFTVPLIIIISFLLIFNFYSKKNFRFHFSFTSAITPISVFHFTG